MKCNTRVAAAGAPAHLLAGAAIFSIRQLYKNRPTTRRFRPGDILQTHGTSKHRMIMIRRYGAGN